MSMFAVMPHCEVFTVFAYMVVADMTHARSLAAAWPTLLHPRADVPKVVFLCNLSLDGKQAVSRL